MQREFYHDLADQSLSGRMLSPETSRMILASPEIELMPLLTAAFEVRRKFTDREVTVHIINNAQNGFCPEDCSYCAQAKSSKADISEYPIKSDEEILQEARKAYEGGAFRYCMVFAGRGPSEKRTQKLADLIRKIKGQYPLEICVSAGLLDDEKAKVLKEAGLDRLNHNLNTSESKYPSICTTHTYQDRMNTLKAARRAGLELCSGIIVGMNEELKDILEVATSLRNLKAKSIPVNFLVPIKGNKLETPKNLTPEFCLRVLCLFRFLNPEAEIRVAAGREVHLRSLEVMSLYPANSLFLQGYLNTKGSSRAKTLQMIKDAGFVIKSDQNLDELISKEEYSEYSATQGPSDSNLGIMKDVRDLRPQFQAKSG